MITIQTITINQTHQEQTPLSHGERGASKRSNASGVCPGRSRAHQPNHQILPHRSDTLIRHDHPLSREPFSLSCQEEIERGARVKAPGRSAAIQTKQPTGASQPAKPTSTHAPFVGRKGRERSEGGMPEAAGRLPTKPPPSHHRSNTQPLPTMQPPNVGAGFKPALPTKPPPKTKRSRSNRPFRMAKGARASEAMRAGYARGGAGHTNQTTASHHRNQPNNQHQIPRIPIQTFCQPAHPCYNEK